MLVFSILNQFQANFLFCTYLLDLRNSPWRCQVVNRSISEIFFQMLNLANETLSILLIIVARGEHDNASHFSYTTNKYLVCFREQADVCGL